MTATFRLPYHYLLVAYWLRRLIFGRDYLRLRNELTRRERIAMLIARWGIAAVSLCFVAIVGMLALQSAGVWIDNPVRAIIIDVVGWSGLTSLVLAIASLIVGPKY